MMPRYALTVENRGCSARIRVNDLPAVELRAAMAGTGRAINEFIVDGENTLTLQVLEAGSGGPEGNESLVVKLSADNIPVCTLAYPAFEASNDLPFSDEDVFEPPEPVEESRWQRGVPVELDAETRESLIAFLRNTESALIAGPLEAAMRLCEARTRERAKAYDLPVEEELAKERAHFAGVSLLGSWLPIDFDGLQSETGGANRVVFVRTREGGEPLRYMPDGEGLLLSFPLAAARIDGEWELVF